MTTIGFANKFYTLWDVSEEIVYFMDSYGKYWPSYTKIHNNYIKNISTDIDKVKALYPNVPINEELRGKSNSFSYNLNQDLSPNILKFGKYRGYDVADLVEKDFNYLLWVVDNCSSATHDAIMNLPKVKEHFKNLELNRQILMDSHPFIVDGEVELLFTSNPNYLVMNMSSYEKEIVDKYMNDKYYATATIGDNNIIYVIFDDIKHVGGMYPYNMGIINGKPMKLKNKKIKLNIKVLYTKKTPNNCFQIVSIV